MLTAAESSLADLCHTVGQFDADDAGVVEGLGSDIDDSVRNPDILTLSDIADQCGSVDQEVPLLSSVLKSSVNRHRGGRRIDVGCLFFDLPDCSAVQLDMKISAAVRKRDSCLAKSDHSVRLQKSRAFPDFPDGTEKSLIGIGLSEAGPADRTNHFICFIQIKCCHCNAHHICHFFCS